MSGAGFRLWEASPKEKKKNLLYFVHKNGTFSKPITGFRTLLNERFNLVPKKGEPFFKIVDSGHNHSFFGCWVGHPSIPEENIVWTSPVIEAQTEDGQCLPTWLLTCDTEPVRGRRVALSEQPFSKKLH